MLVGIKGDLIYDALQDWDKDLVGKPVRLGSTVIPRAFGRIFYVDIEF